MMQSVVDSMRGRGVFASVDLHNNTGLNPHYACINQLDPAFLHLAVMFSRTVVYFTRPVGVQSLAMAALCPAVTLECGKAGQAHGRQHAREFLDACLHLSAHPEHPVAAHDLDLFHTVATVKVPEAISFSFDGRDGVDLALAPDLERLNFRELPQGTPLGRVAAAAGLGLQVLDEQGRDVSAHYLGVEAGALCLRRPVMPSMITRDSRVVRQDCFCYLMERYSQQLKA
jgi:hypothetical protein